MRDAAPFPRRRASPGRLLSAEGRRRFDVIPFAAGMLGVLLAFGGIVTWGVSARPPQGREYLPRSRQAA